MRRLRGALVLLTTMGLLLGTAGAQGATSSPYGARGGKASLQPLVASAWTVTTLEWPAAEPRRGSYNFAKYDALVDEQSAVGVQTQFRVQLCALTPSGAPFWGTYPLPPGSSARATDPCTQQVPRSQQDWYDFVYQLVQHYKGYRHPVRLFAISNEVNTPGQWPGIEGRTACSTASCPVFDDYVTTLRTAQQAAHAANPNVIVLDSGLSSPTMGVATTRAKYEAGGKTDSALKAAVRYLNQYFAYRHPPDVYEPYEYIDPNQPVAQLRAQFTSTFYGTATPQADRFYYMATHMYRTGAMDAIQLHFYDYTPYLKNVLSFIHRQGGGTTPVYCWECGIKWPVKNGQLYNYDPAFMQQKASIGFANGMVQLIYLPLNWGSPPAADETTRDLPLVCGRWTGAAYAGGLCASGGQLTNVGTAFRQLAAGP